jgi:hypothetical protein
MALTLFNTTRTASADDLRRMGFQRSGPQQWASVGVIIHGCANRFREFSSISLSL